jgi:4-hydroxyphenylpyruvate dioxygenase
VITAALTCLYEFVHNGCKRYHTRHDAVTDDQYREKSKAMLKCIATVSIAGSLPEKLAAIAQAGFTAVEIFENDLVVCDRSVRDIRKQMLDLGLSCACYQPFRDFEGLKGDARRKVFDRAERKFALMNELGAELMLLCSSLSPQADGYFGRIADDFRELGDLADQYNVRVAYEALSWAPHVHDHRQAWEIIKRADHPRIGLALDTFHSLARGIPVDTLKDIDGERVFIVQIADAPNIHMDYLYWSRHFRCFPGQGDFPIADYLATIIAQGYTGPLSLEIFNDRFRAWSGDQIARDGLRSLIQLEDQIRTRTPSPLLDPPLAVACQPESVTFIEFAASHDEAKELKAMLGAMGFTEAGRHRTKQVSRWQQNDVNFVVNEDPKGFAYAHQLTHGASVCAFGLGMSDTGLVMQRAKALGIAAFTQESRPQELQMPAVRAVGGTLLYFTPPLPDESFWAQDFDPVPEAKTSQSPGGLLTIDHIAQSMPHEEFLSWVLYYTSLFDMRKSNPVDISDPFGLVQSQAIESPNGALRITLNGAAGQTLSSRFVANYFGAGVQHIAFACDDIFTTATRLEKGGLEILKMSANYYDDLAARFDIDEALMADMKRHNILYDRDAQGEYFQIYTRAFKKLFFFEIVQRRAYQGYGAPNAAARLAAQSRHRVDAL